MTARIDHIKGETFHGRKGAIENAFKYGVDYLMLEPDRAHRGSVFFRRNGRALTSLHDVDHGGTPKDGRGTAWVREVLDAHDLSDVVEGGRIFLLAQPRVLGHVFNPVSFWLIEDADGQLRIVLPEVTNTFGDRHSYLCHRDDLAPITREDTLKAAKIFHVSPFQEVEGDYRFRFDISDEKIGIWIDYSAGENGLYATLTGARSRMTAGSILGACLRRPFGSRRVLGLIHWQALKLWWKGARYNARPEPPVHGVSR